MLWFRIGFDVATLIEPILDFEVEYGIKVPPVSGDKSQVAIRRHTCQPDVLERRVPARSRQRRHDVGGSDGIGCLEREHVKTSDNLALNPAPQPRRFGRARRAKPEFKYRHRANEQT